MHVPDVLDAILAPVRLLAHEVWRWLPIVVALAMLSALPGIFLQVMAPEALSLLGGWMALDPDLLFTGLMIFVMAWSLKLLLELNREPTRSATPIRTTSQCQSFQRMASRPWPILV